MAQRSTMRQPDFLLSFCCTEKAVGAGEGNRTLVVSLGSFCSAIELHPRLANTYTELRPVQACRGCLASRDWRFRPHADAVAIKPPQPSTAQAHPQTVGVAPGRFVASMTAPKASGAGSEEHQS